MPPAFRSVSTLGRSAAILAGAAAVALFAGCGSSSDSGSSSGSSSSGGSSSGIKQLTTATDGLGIFKGANCISCHTLAAAGSSGNIGPNLDNSKPSVDEAVEKMTNGAGSMPSFAKTLTAAQIKTVAEYVHQVTAK